MPFAPVSFPIIKMIEDGTFDKDGKTTELIIRKTPDQLKVTFSQFVLNSGIKLSMDGKGRATDNAFIERLWRTVKYENVYMNEYRNGTELYKGLEQFFHNYNNTRRHSSIDYKRPVDLFLSERA